MRCNRKITIKYKSSTIEFRHKKINGYLLRLALEFRIEIINVYILICIIFSYTKLYCIIHIQENYLKK